VRDAADALHLQTANSWSVVETNPGKRTFFPRLDQTDTFECDGQPACRELSQSFEYDAHGNQSRTVHWGDVATTGDDRDEYTDWIVDTAAWLHRPSRVVVFGPGAQLLRERWISYDNAAWGTLGTRGLVTREESRLAGGRGAPGNPIVARSYDLYGNPLQVTDPRGCAITNVFETTHQTFPQSVKTCLGHTTTFTHDARFGVRLTETDPNQQRTSFVYDDLGRLTRMTGPLDVGSAYGTVTKEYLDLGSPSLQRIVTYRTEQHWHGERHLVPGVVRRPRTGLRNPGRGSGRANDPDRLGLRSSRIRLEDVGAPFRHGSRGLDGAHLRRARPSHASHPAGWVLHDDRVHARARHHHRRAGQGEPESHGCLRTRDAS